MTAARSIDSIGAGTELARYQTTAGERVVMGWRRGGGVEVTDRPSEGRARAYVVDRGIRCFEQLAAFLGEYVDHAVRIDACPMSGEALDPILAQTEFEAIEPLLTREG